jgi:hypothetical protein
MISRVLLYAIPLRLPPAFACLVYVPQHPIESCPFWPVPSCLSPSFRLRISLCCSCALWVFFLESIACPYYFPVRLGNDRLGYVTPSSVEVFTDHSTLSKAASPSSRIRVSSPHA